MSERTAQSGATGPIFEPVIFTCENHAIRTVNDGFIVWLVANDLAEILGCSSLNDLTRAIDDDDKGLHTVRTGDGTRTLVTLSEYGGYQATFKSRKLNIRDIRRWIAGTVIPETLRIGKDARMPTDDTPPEREPGGRSEPREADHAIFRDEPTDKIGVQFIDMLQDLIRLDPRRRQVPVPLPGLGRYPAVADPIEATAPGRMNKTLLLQDHLMMMAQNYQTMKMIQCQWHQEPAFADCNHPRREVIDEITIHIDRTVEAATRVMRFCEEEFGGSKPFNLHFPASND